MNITVIIPTYRRPQHLTRCLAGLKKQQRQADEILIVVRESDRSTWEFLAQFNAELLPIKTLTVKVTGVIAAMNLGLEFATGDIVSFTDDDAIPYPDWLARVEAHFLADPQLVGVGGKDMMYVGQNPIEGQKPIVGKLQWFGRMIANHHLGVGEAREVDFFKGVNMSYRRQTLNGLRFDSRMKGTGAQEHFEIAFCLTLRRAGGKLIYDPGILVDHYLAERFDEDLRDKFNPVAFFNSVHNETIGIVEYLSPPRRAIFAIWAVLVGTRKAFGLVQLFRFLPREGKLAVYKWLISLQGRQQGWSNSKK